MSRKATECENCGMEYTIVYDSDESVEEPVHCPFCGEIASPEDAEDETDYDCDWEE